QMIAEVQAGDGKRMRLVNTPIKMSRTPCTVEQGPPDLGEHSREIISSLLGLSEADLDELERAEVI
ncbi:MAG: CoA transferase, partial [Dehalococcoidia bacterium]|nr:CoA transferase [Dehalococcoidia bacterium]